PPGPVPADQRTPLVRWCVTAEFPPSPASVAKSGTLALPAGFTMALALLIVALLVLMALARFVASAERVVEIAKLVPEVVPLEPPLNWVVAGFVPDTV